MPDEHTQRQRLSRPLHPAPARGAASTSSANRSPTSTTRSPTSVLADHNPALLDTYGVGPDTAAALLIAAGDNPERLRTEASFAALCGVSPVEASSGKTERHRLNRGGDRQANCALRSIVLARLRWDQRTRDYIDRRVSDGKTRREAIQCLKRYLSREIYRIIASPGL